MGEKKYPRVALMARQFLAIPATSADVERLFSKAGRAYASFAHAMAEGTLEARMFAGINVMKLHEYNMDDDDDDDDCGAEEEGGAVDAEATHSKL